MQTVNRFDVSAAMPNPALKRTATPPLSSALGSFQIMSKIFLRFVNSLLILVALNACTSWKAASIASIDPDSGWKLSYPAYAGVEGNAIEDNDILLTVLPQNFEKTFTFMILPLPFPLGYHGQDRGNDYFAITVFARSKTKGASFQPLDTQVKFLSPNTKTLQPVGYLVLSKPPADWYGVNCISVPFNSKGLIQEVSGLEQHRDKALVIDSGVCTAIFFDTLPPSVSELFTLRIDGISKNGNQIKVPLLQFKKGHAVGGW